MSWTTQNMKNCIDYMKNTSGLSGSSTYTNNAFDSVWYKIVCTDYNGYAVSFADIVTGTAPVAITGTISTDKTTITAGDSVSVTWNSVNANNCWMN